MSTALQAHPDGIVIAVRLTPKSARDAVEGLAQTSDGKVHLKARVRAVPEKGKANKALEKLLAGWLSVPCSGVSLISGDTTRLKSVLVSGEATLLAERFARLAGQAAAD